MAEIVISELKTEITTDPVGLGYAGKTDKEVADTMNLVRDTITIDVDRVSNEGLLAAVVGSEFMALTAEKQRGWLAIMALDNVPVRNTNIRGQIAAIWGAATTTRQNLLDLQTKDGSRAEAIWGDGAKVTHLDVAKARI